MADNYVRGAYEDSGTDAPVGTLGDFGKTLVAGTAGLGSNLAAAYRYGFELGGSENGADIAQGIQKIFGAAQGATEETINPETRKLASSTFTSPEFWEHPVLATALKATGMAPAVMALAIPGGLMADAIGATVMAAAGGAAINAGTGLDEFYKKLGEMSDEELQAQSPKYKALRDMLGEKAARAQFNKEAQGWGPGINAVIGALAGSVGAAGQAGRALAGGRAVAGAETRLGAGALGALEGGGTNALQAGVSDVTQQNAEINAQLQDHFDLARSANAALEGGVLGGLMGGAVGLVAGGGAHAKTEARPPPLPGAEPPPLPAAQAGVEHVSSDAATPQPKTTGASLRPAKPAEDAPVGNEQNAPTRSDTEYGKGQKKPPRTPAEVGPITVDPAIAQATGVAQGTPNETIAKLTAGEQAQQPPVTPQGNAPLDTGQNVPEKPASVAEQLKQVGTGDRKAVMVPKGTVVPAAIVPTGYKSTVTPRGRFIYDPKLIKPAEIRKLSEAGRENEILGLGPVSKPEVAAPAAQGEPVTAVTERTPDGTEVKAAAGTAGTAPAQIASLEAQKTPGNVVAVERPETVIAKRMMQPEKPPGRVLPNLAQEPLTAEQQAKGKLKSATKAGEAAIAHAEAMKAHEAETARLIAEGKTQKELPVEPQEPVVEKEGGKRYSEEERKLLNERLAKAKKITDAHVPDVEREREYMRNPEIRDQIAARAEAMLAAAKKVGLRVQGQLKASEKGDAASDHPSIQVLRAAQDMAKVTSKHKEGRLRTEAVGKFAEAERLIRGGASEEMLAQRREEGDISRKRGVAGEQVAAATVEAPKAELSGETPDVVDTKAVSKDDVVTSAAKSAKMGARGLSPETVKREVTTKEGHVQEVEAAVSAGGLKEHTPEEKAKLIKEAQERYGTPGKPKVEVKKGAPERAPTKNKGTTEGEFKRLIKAHKEDEEREAAVPEDRLTKSQLEKRKQSEAIKAELEKGEDAAAKWLAQNERENMRAEPNPSPAQIEANNYRHGHRNIEGLDYSIENHKGMIRRGIDPETGKPWKVKMPADYGYIRGTKGADGDHIDAYDLKTGKKHYVVDQLEHPSGEFDEHKLMLRAKDEQHALGTYEKSFSDGHGMDRVGNLHEVTMPELKGWLKSGETKDPMTQHMLGPHYEDEYGTYDQSKGVVGGKTYRPEPHHADIGAVHSDLLYNVMQRFDFSQHGWEVPTILANFFKSRLIALAKNSGTVVHFVTPEQMKNLHKPGERVAMGFHIQDAQGISHIVVQNNLRDVGLVRGSFAHVVMHEAIHSITVREIMSNPAAMATIRHFMDTTKKWLAHPDNAIEAELGAKEIAEYALKNEKEFIAEAFSNPRFQELLTKIPMNDPALAKYLKMDREKVTVWDKFRSLVKQSVEKFTGKMPQFDSVLDGIMRMGEHLETAYGQDYLVPRKAGKQVTPQGMVERQAFHTAEGVDRSVKRMLEDALNRNPEKAPWALRYRTFDNIAEIARRYFGEGNPVDKIHQAIERMRVTGQKIFEDRTGPIIQKLVALRAGNPTQFGEFARLLHDVTVADVHPDVAVTDAKNQHLGKDKVVGRSAWQKAQHPELSKRYNELSPEFKDMYHEVVKHFTDTQNEMTLSTMKNVVEKLTGARDDALAERIHEGTVTDADKAALGETLSIIEKASELSKIHGPYVPLMRRGDHVVKGTRKVATPQGAKRISENEFEFKNEKDATGYAKQSDLSANVKKVWVDKNTGETTEIDPATNKERKILASDTDSVPVYRVEVQNEHMEYIEGRKAAERRKAELAQDPNMNMHEVVPRAYEPGGRAAVDLSASLRNLVKKLEHSEAYKQASPAQQAALRHAVEEAAAGAHGSTRISSRALPRRNVKGYSEDIVQNTVDYGASSSRYLARLQHGPALEAGMEQMASQLKRDESKTGQYARSSISDEVRRRVDGSDSFDQGGKYNPIVKRLLSLSFIDKLGSPAYSVINAMQPGMVTMPYLIGRHGVGRSFREMARAYSDISALKMIRAGIKETGRRIVGKGSPEDFLTSITKNLTPEERAMIKHHIGLGTIDPNAGLEVANIAKRYEGIGGSADKILGYMEGVTREMPRTIEAINRAVTALAAYRLERGKGTSHEKAMQYSVDAVNSTQFNYSPTNTPPIFNHPLLKVALQFKKYGQGMYQLMGNQIGNAIRNESPGDRAQAIKTLITLAATHTAIAGALGLPTEPFKYLIMPLHGMGLIKTSWGDVENKIREQAAGMFGKTGGEALTRGIPRLFNVDLSRAGLDSITSFGEPKSQKESDVKSWLFDSVAGPVVSLGGDWVKGLGQITNGEFGKAAENLIPLKAASDSLRAYRQATEGKKTATGKQSMGAYTPYETGLRVLGFGSGREAEIGAERSAYYRQSAQQKEERGALVNAWSNADNAGKTKAWAAIQKYNQQQPDEVKITPKELTAKAKRDAKQAETARFGITPSKRDKRFLSEGVYSTGAQ